MFEHIEQATQTAGTRCRTSAKRFPTSARQTGARFIMENFANAILHGEPLVAPAVEGIRSLTLGNGIMYSSFLGQPVELPFDQDGYAARLEELIRTSRFKKTVREVSFTEEDLLKAFGYH